MLGSSAWRDAAVERRFDLIARRIAEVAAAATRNAEVPGIYWEYSVAQRNLRSALATADAELPKTQLTDDSVNPEAVRLGRVSADDASPRSQAS